MNYQRTNLQTVGGWVSRLLRFDFTAFEEIRADPPATSAAVLVVIAASVLAGIGSWLWAIQSDLDGTEVFIKSLVLGAIIQTIVWFLWVYVSYQVLTRAYGVRADFAELTRTMGFAFAPIGFSILIVIQGFAVPFGLIAFSLAVLISNSAIQYATDVDVREATMANVTGFSAFVIVMGIFANIAEVSTAGGLAPGILFFSLDLG
jgi:hypothetical protein